MASNLLDRQPKKKVTNDLFKQNTENNTGIQTIENNEVNTYNKEETPESPEQTIEMVKDEPVVEYVVETPVEEIKQEPMEQVQNTTITVINPESSISEAYDYSEKEQSFIDRLAEIRDLIDNPKTIDKMKKRRKYTSDKRRNVTFSIRDDLAFLVDDLVDEAKIYKGLFQDEVLLLGIEAYIQKYGI